MLHIRVFLLAILTTILLVSCDYDSRKKDSNEFIVQGVVLDEKVDTLYLYNHGEFGLNEGIKIPVTEGKFDYILPIQHAQGYILNLDYSVANGGGPFLLFFVDEGITKLTIHKEEEFNQNLVVGSTINEDYQIFQNLRQSY